MTTIASERHEKCGSMTYVVGDDGERFCVACSEKVSETDN